MGTNESLAALLSLVAGAVMSVTVSCVWTVLHLPARLQDVFQAGAPRMFAWAMLSGLAFASVAMTPGIGAPLPTWVGGAGMLLSGIFVGMLASALEKILEVAPVLLRRFRIGDVSLGIRWVMLIGKTLGAVLGCMLYPP